MTEIARVARLLKTGGVALRSCRHSSPGEDVRTWPVSSRVAEFPATRWLIPYVEGGGGVANVSQSSSIGPLLPPGTGRGIFDRGRRGMDVERITGTAERRRAETDLALTVGGGVDFRIWRGLAVGVNLSYLSLMGNLQDRNLTQIGTRASYRF
jgi:opacity protein-like surface antigen